MEQLRLVKLARQLYIACVLAYRLQGVIFCSYLVASQAFVALRSWGVDENPGFRKWSKWKETMGNLKVVNFAICGHEERLGKGEYRLARVKEVIPDESGLVRSAIIEFRPWDGPAGLLTPPKDWRRGEYQFRSWC